MNPHSSAGWRVLRYLLAALLFLRLPARPRALCRSSRATDCSHLARCCWRPLPFEAAAATYLVVGSASLSWILTIGVFSTLTLAAGYAIVANRDCNCFSNTAGSRITLPLNVIILVLTGCLRPRIGIVHDPRLAVHVVCSVVVGGMFAGAAVLQERSASSRPESLSISPRVSWSESRGR